jgi:hypothetical protein
VTGDDLLIPPVPTKVADAMLAAFAAGEALERARHGWWWQRRARKREAQRLHWLAFGWLGDNLEPGDP